MIGALTEICRPVFCTFSFMPRLNPPEQSRRKATRSRWLGSMLAWTLNTKPDTSGSPGTTWVSSPERVAASGLGGGQ